MSPRNPFAAWMRQHYPDGVPDAPPEGTTTGAAIIVVAADLWEVFDQLPGKAEATLAQRRLEEAVFWAGRAGA